MEAPPRLLDQRPALHALHGVRRAVMAGGFLTLPPPSLGPPTCASCEIIQPVGNRQEVRLVWSKTLVFISFIHVAINLIHPSPMSPAPKEALSFSVGVNDLEVLGAGVACAAAGPWVGILALPPALELGFSVPQSLWQLDGDNAGSCFPEGQVSSVQEQWWLTWGRPPRVPAPMVTL